MLPTPRLLFLLLLGAVVVAGASFTQPLTWLAVIYFVALLGLVIADYVISTKPDQITIRRVNESKLSLGVPNLITLVLENASPRAVRFKLRDEYPYQFRADQDLLDGQIPPLDSVETRYHVTPVQR